MPPCLCGLPLQKEGSAAPLCCRVVLSAGLKQQELSSSSLVTAGQELLQQMCSSAPQPKDIPFGFRALAVVAGQRPAVWTLGWQP